MVDRWRNNGGFLNVKFRGEHASPYHKAAETFPAQLEQLIKKKEYVSEQVFNADETSLFWKKMLRTFISQQERTASGFKAAKDHISLLICANAKKDCLHDYTDDAASFPKPAYSQGQK